MAMLSKKGYLKRIKVATEKDQSHPRHNGVKMQAHHLLSAKGIDKAGKSDELKHLEYDINKVANLAFIPSSLQGACHLETQLHRGDHKTNDPRLVTDPNGTDDPDAHDNDGLHHRTYHDTVERLVIKLFKKYDTCSMKPGEIQRKMNNLSSQMLKKINAYEVSLTRIAKNFQHHENGCMGIDNIPSNIEQKLTHVCPVGRDHYQGQGQGQQSENIRFRKRAYTLEAGK